jgi:predicted RNA-binding Zn-ribbon protein involved in translation (DUF1610 family)
VKTTGQCPKCGSTEILRVPGSSGLRESTNPLPLAGLVGGSVWVDRHACSNCGYVENWVNEGDLERLRARLSTFRGRRHPDTAGGTAKADAPTVPDIQR